ncbi:MAG: transglutaminase-like domain-containing protein [Candidatus Riflemargulisbacteria bacterium]
MVINNVGIESQGGVNQRLPETILQEDGLVQQSVEMESSYAGSSKQGDYQFFKIEINGQKYTGIPDIFQSNDPAVQALFDTLRSDFVITDDMSLEDQQKIMSYLAELSLTIQANANINKATAFDGTNNVDITSFIQPQNASVVDLASQLMAQGIITDTMTDAEKLSAITKYVNSNVRYEADVPGEGWSSASNTLASGSGDCEDMAILVANLAIACGVDESKVQVCVTSGDASTQGHVVVGLVGGSGQITTYDATNLTQGTAELSDFAFTFSSQEVTSGDGSVGNAWSMEDGNNVNSLYTAGTTPNTSSLSQVRHDIGDSIDSTYRSMLDFANNLTSYTDPGALFQLQQKLQTMKDMIATYTAVGKMIGDTLSEAMKSFSQALSR